MSDTSIGLRGIGAKLAPTRMTLEELAARGWLESPPENLRKLGFSYAHIAQGPQAVMELATTSARQALQNARLNPADIDAVIWASALAQNHLAPAQALNASPHRNLLAQFQYAGGCFQEQLGLENAQFLAVAQQGCCTMFTALRLARSLLLSDPGMSHVLCVGADALPSESPREIMYNLISDAGCAAIVSRDAPQDRWIGFHQITKAYYWDTIAREKEIIAAYFPTARMAIDQALAAAGLTPADIDIVIPTGVSRASWEILLRLIGIDAAKLYDGGISFGHTIASDSLLFLQRLQEENRLPPGSRMLLFTYGFGSSWCALILEH